MPTYLSELAISESASSTRAAPSCATNNATALADLVTVDEDPLNLIWVAETFKDSIVFPYLIIVAIVLAFLTFLLLATFPGWHTDTSSSGSEHEVKPFPSRPVSQVALATIFIASVFVLVSVLWQHTAAVAASTVAQDLGNGSREVRGGNHSHDTGLVSALDCL